jgi:ribonuclease P/MRP protein subunit POP5
MRPMPRKPSRYILVKVVAEGTVPKEALRLSVMESILRLFGETGLAEAEPRLFDYNERTSTGIFKCTRDSIEKMRAAFAMMSRIAEMSACLYVCTVSGTSKGLKTRRRI